MFFFEERVKRREYRGKSKEEREERVKKKDFLK